MILRDYSMHFFLGFAGLGEDGDDGDDDDSEESQDGTLGLAAKRRVRSALKDISPHMIRQIGW